MTGHALRAFLRNDALSLVRDPLLAWLMLLPVGLALMLRLLLPRVSEVLRTAASVDLLPYHPLIMSGYILTAPGIVGMVIGFLLLDERDSRTLDALRVTPLAMGWYAAYRVTLPLLLGLVSTFVGYSLVQLAPLPWPTLVAIALVAGLTAPTLTLLLAWAAPNKVAGFAVVKVVNTVNLLPLAAFFVPLPYQRIAGVLPTYWPMRAMWSASAGASFGEELAIGLLVNILAVAMMARLFQRRLLKSG